MLLQCVCVGYHNLTQGARKARPDSDFKALLQTLKNILLSVSSCLPIVPIMALLIENVQRAVHK